MSNNEEKKDPLLLEHNYDGIEECDYPLPKYWVVTFAITKSLEEKGYNKSMWMK